MELVKFTPIIKTFLNIKNNNNLQIEDVYNKIMQTIKENIFDSTKNSFINENYISGFYPICALIDETMMQNFKLSWLKYSLQQYFFNSHVAGEEFFVKLDALLQEKTLNYDLLLLYNTCLQLGFKGKYSITKDNKLQIYYDKLNKCLAPMVNKSCSNDDLTNKRKKKINKLLVLVAILGGCYVASHWQIIKKIQEIKIYQQKTKATN